MDTNTLVTGGAMYAVGQVVLGKTLETIGEDINKLYIAGRDGVLAAAERKIKDRADGKSANLRVAREVFWNGSFTDEAICAEYFGGILASSRSEGGKDDSGIFYVDIIRSLSSAQLRLHYVIYNSFRKGFFEAELPPGVNVAMRTSLEQYRVVFDLHELGAMGLNPINDLIALHQKGLIGSYRSSPLDTNEMVLDKNVPGLPEYPLVLIITSLGVQLYMQAANEFAAWRRFLDKELDVADFETVALPASYSVMLA